MSFEDYWETDGSRQDIADHKERARLAWEAGYKEGRRITNDDWEIVEQFRERESRMRGFC